MSPNKYMHISGLTELHDKAPYAPENIWIL